MQFNLLSTQPLPCLGQHWVGFLVDLSRLQLLTCIAYAALLTVPTTPFTDAGGSYSLSNLKSIVVDSRYANSVDQDGETLIPPTLQQFAETFQEDVNSVLGLDLPLSQGSGRLMRSL